MIFLQFLQTLGFITIYIFIGIIVGIFFGSRKHNKTEEDVIQTIKFCAFFWPIMIFLFILGKIIRFFNMVCKFAAKAVR